MVLKRPASSSLLAEQRVQLNTDATPLDSLPTGQKTGKRPYQRRSPTEKLVNQGISDNFKGWSNVAIDATLVDGVSLRDRLRKDKERIRDAVALGKPPPLRMGALYFKNLRMLYGGHSTSTDVLKITDSTEEIDTLIVKGIKAARKDEDFEPILFFMKNLEVMKNRSSYCRWLRYLLTLRPDVSPQHHLAVTTGVQMIVRLELDTTW